LGFVYEILHHSDFDAVADYIVVEAPLTQEVSPVYRLTDLFLHCFDLLVDLFGCQVS
jgi:hypothetical protein